MNPTETTENVEITETTLQNQETIDNVENELGDEAAEEPSDDAGDSADSEAPNEEKWPKKAENAVSRLKAQRAKLQQQRDDLRRETQYLRTQLEGNQPPKELKEDEFDSYADFLLAKAELKMGEKQTAQVNERLSNLQQQDKQLFLEERAVSFDSKLSELKAVTADYSQVETYAEPIVASFPQELKEGILALDNAPKALYNLAKAGRLESLAYMPTAAALAEVVQAQYREVVGAIQKKTITSAPKPLKAVSGTGKRNTELHEKTGDQILEWLKT